MGWQDDPILSSATAPAKSGGAPWERDPIAEPPARDERGVLKRVADSEAGLLRKAYDMFTGASRTEHPAAGEFVPKFMEQTGGANSEGYAALNRSAIASNPDAAVDILRKQVPGLETKKDKHGNVMLWAPGMSDWAYLNKPGLSGRDIDEIGTQTLATLPMLGAAGAGATVPARIASGAGFMGASDLALQGMEKAAGSEQDYSPTRTAIATGVGAVAAPGVPSAILQGVKDAASAVVAPFSNLYRKIARPGAEADRRVALAYREAQGNPADRTALGEMAPNYAQRAAQDIDPAELQRRAANQLQERAGTVGDGTYGAEARIMDIGGAPMAALARSAANTSPAARDTLNQVIQPRFETQGPRVVEFLDGLIAGPTAGQTREGLQEMAQTMRQPLYETAYREGSRGVMTPELRRIMNAPAVQNAIERAGPALENRAAVNRLVTAAQGPNGPTIEMWDQVKRLLNDDFNRLSGQGRTSAAADVAAILDRMVNALDDAVPSYRTARGVAMGLFRANNALEAGENFVASRLRNEQAEQAVNMLTPLEQDLFARGFMSRFISQVQEMGDRRNVLNQIAHSPAARRRLEIAVGEERTRELEAFLRHEGMMDLIRSAVQGNSTTVRQLMELGLAGGAGGLMTGFDPSNPVFWITAILTRMGASRANQAIDARLANEVAQRLVSRDPAVMRRGLQQLAQPEFLTALRRFDESMARAPRNAAVQASVPQQREPSNAMGAPAPGNAMKTDERISEGATATNPETGERRVYRGGRWQVLQ